MGEGVIISRTDKIQRNRLKNFGTDAGGGLHRGNMYG
jgi:hypothetical protein